MTDDTIETQEAPKIVEGSDGYLIEVDGEIVPNYDATINVFGEGDIVTGKVVRIDKDEVLVDIGYKSEGVIPVNELSIRKNVNTLQEVELGEEVDALVMQKEDADGRLILSKKRARFEKAWKRIEGAFESGTPVIGTVIEVVKGGLILDLGVRGFLPASLVDIRRVQDLSEYVTKELNCRVIEMNRNRNNVVLSRRAVLEEERKEVRQQIIDELTVGDIVEGTISNIVDFGAFVDLDGIDGLIHISELSWTHINHPSEVLQVNQKVKVKVLDIDRDRQRISLGLKQTQEDPWQRIVTRHKVGDTVDGRVTKIVAFGAFIEIYEGIEGLVHISELANRHVERPDEVVAVGQTVRVKIIEVDTERRRLSLSIKRVEGADDVRPTPPAPVEFEEPEAEVAEETAADEAEVAEETAADEATEQSAADEAAEAATEEVAETPADEAAAAEETATEGAVEAPADEAADEAVTAEEPEAAAEPETVEEPAAAAEPEAVEEPAAAAEPATVEETAEGPVAAETTVEAPAAEPETVEADDAEEEAAEVAPPLDEGPTLGLSDEVFPVGAEPAEEAPDTDAGEAEAEPQA